MGNSTVNVLSVLLLGGLVGCGQPQPVTVTEDSVTEDATGAIAETSDDGSTSTASQDQASDAPSSVPGPEVEEAVPTPAVSRSSPVALAKKDCGQLTTQQDMNQCAAENYAVSDKALNQVYQEVRQNLNDAAKGRLTQAEEYWIVFRDAQCGFESDRFVGGSIAPFIQATCMEQITDNRIAELRQTVKTDTGFAEADAQLNDVYQSVQALASEDVGEALVDVQLAWLDYRDSHCEYEANLPSSPDIKACLAAITETRVWQLETLEDEWSL